MKTTPEDTVKEEDAVGVKVIAEEDKLEEGNSIAEHVGKLLFEKAKRKPLIRKPVVLMLPNDSKKVPDGLLKLGMPDKEEQETVVFTVSGGGTTKRPVQLSVESYLTTRGVIYTCDLNELIELCSS